MRFAITASALFAGFAAAAPAVTQTLYSTAVQTITSCGPEVTNCPARTSTVSSVVSTSVPVVIAPIQNTTSSAAPMLSTVTLYSTQEVTITSCAATVTNCPARVSSSVVSVGTTVIPVVINVPTSAPYAITNGTMPAKGPSGTAASTGFAATSTHPAMYTGAASQVNAGMVLAGVAGFAALLI